MKGQFKRLTTEVCGNPRQNLNQIGNGNSNMAATKQETPIARLPEQFINDIQTAISHIIGDQLSNGFVQILFDKSGGSKFNMAAEADPKRGIPISQLTGVIETKFQRIALYF